MLLSTPTWQWKGNTRQMIWLWKTRCCCPLSNPWMVFLNLSSSSWWIIGVIVRNIANLGYHAFISPYSWKHWPKKTISKNTVALQRRILFTIVVLMEILTEKIGILWKYSSPKSHLPSFSQENSGVFQVLHFRLLHRWHRRHRRLPLCRRHLGRHRRSFWCWAGTGLEDVTRWWTQWSVYYLDYCVYISYRSRYIHMCVYTIYTMVIYIYICVCVIDDEVINI